MQKDSTPNDMIHALRTMRSNFPLQCEWNSQMTEMRPGSPWHRAPWGKWHLDTLKQNIQKQKQHGASISEADYVDIAQALARTPSGLPERFKNKLKDKIKNPEQRDRVRLLLQKRKIEDPSKN